MTKPKPTPGVIYLLKKEKISLKEAIKRGLVRLNKNNKYILTGKGNKLKQRLSGKIRVQWWFP